MEIRQYQIVIVNLDPTVGSKIKKTRPCVVISPDEMNRHLNTITIAPITSRNKKLPTRVPVTFEQIQGQIVIDQIRTIDKRRVTRVTTELSTKESLEVKSVIKKTFVD